MGSLSALQVLFVHNNNLHGTIPDSFGELCSLEALSLFSNNLSGTIPLSLTQIKGLQHLLLHKNTFSCCMDAILSGFNGHNISSIFVYDNPDLYADFSTMKSVEINHLTSFVAHGCDLYGTLPKSVQFQNVKSLLMYNNRLSGELHE
eukprot:705394_1